MSLSPFLSLNCSCEEALRRTREHLSQAGLHSVQTFDLHAARLGSHDCPCPNHGTSECDCQMVVILVYEGAKHVPTPRAANPVTLILHGSDGMTWLSLAEEPREEANVKLSSEIRQMLEAAFVSAS